MAELRLRAAAKADLMRIGREGCDMFGEAVGLAYLKSFDRIFDLLRSHPEAGALRGDLHPPIRSISHRSHRIFYTFEDDVIRIVRVLHHAMDERRWLPG